jgi:hypothetical protein
MNSEWPKIKIKGLTSRAKSRIGTYSNNGIFFLRRDLRKEGDEEKILVEALEPNLKLSDKLTIPWGGWFDIGTEIEIVDEEISTECA